LHDTVSTVSRVNDNRPGADLNHPRPGLAQQPEFRSSRSVYHCSVHRCSSQDGAAYDELCAAIKPADIIDEMFIDDIVSLEWEILRWRRLKRILMQEAKT
jgi:hypothetical protein